MGIQIANVWHFDSRLYPIRPIWGSPNTAFKPSLGELYKKHSVLHQNWPILDLKSKNFPPSLTSRRLRCLDPRACAITWHSQSSYFRKRSLLSILLQVWWQLMTISLFTRKPCCCRENALCSMFFPTPTNYLIVIYIHCIKADVNVKL